MLCVYIHICIWRERERERYSIVWLSRGALRGGLDRGASQRAAGGERDFMFDDIVRRDCEGVQGLHWIKRWSQFQKNLPAP